MGQHQIAVHTWSHTSLTTQTNEEIIAELGWSKKVIKDVLGVTPNTMRPPYGDIEYVLIISLLVFFTDPLPVIASVPSLWPWVLLPSFGPESVRYPLSILEVNVSFFHGFSLC
jgi:peptidoglycan/xylan/chitin deacetylase (PgdA/CDA1 family)